jgi:hypothetical protein
VSFPNSLAETLQKLLKTKSLVFKGKDKGRGGAKLGHLYLMSYDPKWKEQLPFYDVLPLFILLGRSDDRFFGINIHYLPWTYRIQLVRRLLSATKNKKRLKYLDIKKAWVSAKIPMAYAYLCFRSYLFNHIRSNIAEIPLDNYDAVVKTIRPKFMEEDEMTIIKYIMWKFRTHKKSITSGKKQSTGFKSYMNSNKPKKGK